MGKWATDPKTVVRFMTDCDFHSHDADDGTTTVLGNAVRPLLLRPTAVDLVNTKGMTTERTNLMPATLKSQRAEAAGHLSGQLAES